MARIRTIKPSFFKNEQLAELPAMTRILFIGLWCLADKEGRLEDRPKRIKAELFPYDAIDIDQTLSRLQSAGFIHRYEIGDLKVIQIINFLKHQRITGSEAHSESELPAYQSDNPEETTWKQLGNTLETPRTTGKERKGKEGKGLPESPGGEILFENFWNEYDKKVGQKEKLQKKWEKLTATDHQKIMQYIQKYKIAQPDKIFRKNPETFLNNRGWEDELINSKTPVNGKTADPPPKQIPKSMTDELNYLYEKFKDGDLDIKLIRKDHYDFMVARNILPVGLFKEAPTIEKIQIVIINVFKARLADEVQSI